MKDARQEGRRGSARNEGEEFIGKPSVFHPSKLLARQAGKGGPSRASCWTGRPARGRNIGASAGPGHAVDGDSPFTSLPAMLQNLPFLKRVLFSVSQDRGHKAGVAASVHYGHHPQWLFIRRVGN